MTEQTQRILSQNATLFEEGPPPIYLLKDGRFAVEHGGKWVAKASAAAARRLANKAAPVLRILSFYTSWRTSSQDFTIDVFDAADMGSNQLRDGAGKRHYLHGSQYVHTPELLAALKDLFRRRKEAEKAFEAEFDGIMKGAVRVSHDNFKKLLRDYGPKAIAPDIFGEDNKYEGTT